MHKIILPALLACMLCVGSIDAQASTSTPVPKMFGIFSNQTDLVAKAGFGWAEYNLRVTAGNKSLASLAPTDIQPLADFMAGAEKDDLQVVLNVWQVGWPLSNGKQYGAPGYPNQYRGMSDVVNDALDQYPQIKAVVLGVEPNSCYFWRNQKNAPAAYEAWLATFYAREKQKHPDVQIYGGSLASRADGCGTGPEAFIAGMCQAYNAGSAQGPIMDGFAMHSYEASAPETQHPGADFIAIGDYQTLERDLACFGQGPIPILWNEVGYESRIPDWQAYRYINPDRQSASSPMLDETTQGQYYARALKMAYDQPCTAGLFIFHASDDSDIGQWQSGLFYADVNGKTGKHYADVAKTSLGIVQKEAAAVQGGYTQCGN